MNIGSRSNSHWTDEQVIEHLYGVGPEDRHLVSCVKCRDRVAVVQARWRSIEEGTGDEVSFEFLAAQRRKVYARLADQVGWRRMFQARRWAPAAMALFVIGAGLAVFEETHPLGLGGPHGQVVNSNISDADLASEVGGFADGSEPTATAPLQALFEE